MWEAHEDGNGRYVVVDASETVRAVYENVTALACRHAELMEYSRKMEAMLHALRYRGDVPKHVRREIDSLLK